MRIVKRLYLFILKSFLPLFAMTFFIVLFIVLMQFLWKHIDDLVGKGLPFSLIAELFFYAGVSMVPMALPLAILLASLMTFGNFGEKFELTAMKASGISLIHAMRPLIVLISFIAVGAFFFQNYVLPPAQVKMWTLLFSMRQKSPEVEIPEGVFYDQIPGYNLLVQSKNRDTGMLYDVMIYDVTRGGDNATILVADSGQMAFTADMRYLYLHLFTGEQFENLREQKALDKNVPFRREMFDDKQILIPFDANFNRLDEGGIRSQYVGKNIIELRHTIDSVENRIDSTGSLYAMELRKTAFPLLVDRRTGKPIFTEDGKEAAEELKSNNQNPDKRGNIKNRRNNTPSSGKKDVENQNPENNLSVTNQTSDKNSAKTEKDTVLEAAVLPLDIDSLIMSVTDSKRGHIFDNALIHTKRQVADFQFKSAMISDDKITIRRHEIELLKKYTLSVACLIFFFIGAPLGAIIRKGGLGTPLVISVLLFLFYYIIDNAGYKMARDGRWEVWIGIWLSTFVLAPLGIYVTYQAMNDSAVFNADSYKELMRKLLGIRPPRSIGRKEVVINEISPEEASNKIIALRDLCERIIREIEENKSYNLFWKNSHVGADLQKAGEDVDSLAEYLTDTRNNAIVDRLSEFPWIYSNLIINPLAGSTLASIFKWIYPLSYPVYLLSINRRQKMIKNLDATITLCNELYLAINPGADIPQPIKTEIENPHKNSEETIDENNGDDDGGLNESEGKTTDSEIRD